MRLQDPLSVITPTLDGQVLAVLARTSRAFTAGDLHRMLGSHSRSGVRKVLRRLEGEGIILAGSVGNAIVYRFNADHLAASAIVELATLRGTLLERLRGAFASWDTAPVFAALFGSAARGAMGLTSDVDLFVVRPDGLVPSVRNQWADDLVALQESVSRWTGNDARTLEMSASEVRSGLGDEPVLLSVRRDGVLLYGSTEFWRDADGSHSEVHASDT